MEIKKLPEDYDYPAPDQSQIRLLLKMEGGELAHCTLPSQGVSLAVKHKTVEEIWYFIQGHGQVWLSQEDKNKIFDVEPDICITIPTGAHFQFRNTGNEPLCFIIATMPPWPGEQEAERVPDHWKVEG